jgi:hypothetical protein
MFSNRLIQLGSLAIIMSAGIMVSCGPSAEELAVTFVAQTAAAATDTPKPTPTPTPTEIPPTFTPSPSHTPTFTPTPEPQIVFLRDAPGCDLQHDIIANSPIELHYGAWGSLNKAYAEGSWDLYVSTLTMDGEEIEGEKQPVRMSAKLVKRCGSGPPPEGAYATVYIARFEGIPPGVHYLEVTYGANGVIEDGWVQVGPGTFAIKYFTLYSATE